MPHIVGKLRRQGFQIGKELEELSSKLKLWLIKGSWNPIAILL